MTKDLEQEEQDELSRDDDGFRQRIDRLVPEILRRTFYAGLGAVFTTEEGIRKVANEFSLPKDMATYLVQQAQGTKKELFRIVAQEMRAFLENLNFNEEMQRLLTSLSFEIKTEIRFIPNDAKLVKPNIKNKISVKRTTEDDGVEDVPLFDEEVEQEEEAKPTKPARKRSRKEPPKSEADED